MDIKNGLKWRIKKMKLAVKFEVDAKCWDNSKKNLTQTDENENNLISPRNNVTQVFYCSIFGTERERDFNF